MAKVSKKKRKGAKNLMPAFPPNLKILTNRLNRYSGAQWASTGLTVRGVFDLSPASPGGRFLVLGAAFASLVIICMYTAAFSASQVGGRPF